VQLFFEQQPGAVQRPFTLVSFASAQTDNEVELHTHASGRVAPLQALPAQMQLAALQQLCTEPVDLAALDARLAAAQLDLGPTFRWIAQGWSAPAQAVPQLLARLARPSVVEEGRAICSTRPARRLFPGGESGRRTGGWRPALCAGRTPSLPPASG
jgi:hypothetical protein